MFRINRRASNIKFVPRQLFIADTHEAETNAGKYARHIKSSNRPGSSRSWLA